MTECPVLQAFLDGPGWIRTNDLGIKSLAAAAERDCVWLKQPARLSIPSCRKLRGTTGHGDRPALRFVLASWLEGAGASNADRDSILLATHEAAVRAMQTGEDGGTVEVIASQNDDESFLIHVRNDDRWAQLADDSPHNVGVSRS
jgi:hypothetical protein